LNSVKLSIIISVLNGEKYIGDTIKSILNQNYPNKELIIIDGGSKDGTTDILKKYSSKIQWISEPDNGISDAFNKGIKLATGDFINFQGDGDGFIHDSVLTEIFDNRVLKKDIIICGNIIRIDNNGKKLFKTRLKVKFSKKSLLFKMSLPHQGLFLPKPFFDKYGLFDLNTKFAMDYELLLRAYKSFPEVKIINTPIAYWRADGLGEGKTLKILKEYLKIKNKNKVENQLILYIIYITDVTKYVIKSIFKKVKLY
jgi:glycosyltransferase involved in cell wall biosynthesis